MGGAAVGSARRRLRADVLAVLLRHLTVTLAGVLRLPDPLLVAAAAPAAAAATARRRVVARTVRLRSERRVGRVGHIGRGNERRSSDEVAMQAEGPECGRKSTDRPKPPVWLDSSLRATRADPIIVAITNPEHCSEKILIQTPSNRLRPGAIAYLLALFVDKTIIFLQHVLSP